MIATDERNDGDHGNFVVIVVDERNDGDGWFVPVLMGDRNERS